jgi:hypothetical protein
MPADRVRLQRVAKALVGAGDELVHLGTGGFASTFKVTHPDGSCVALKIVDPDVSDVDRFDRELAALQRVSHQNVVSYRRFGEVQFDDRAFRWIEMDFVDGRSLSEILSSESLPTTAGAALMLRQLVDGAAAIWAQSTAHRDLSPNNILVTREGQPVIVDLGMARHVDDETITVLPTPGTPGWMSPEQVGSSPLHGDWRSDQYVLGLVGYTLLTGTAPFVARNRMELWLAPANTSPRLVRAAAPSVPAVIADIVDRMLAKQPHRRYLRANALLSDLDRAVAALAADGTSPELATRFYLEISQAKTFAESGFIADLAPAGIIIDARARARVSEFCVAAQDAKAQAVIDPVTTFARSPLEARPSYYQQLIHGQEPALRVFADDAARRDWLAPLVEHYTSEAPDVLIAPYFYAGAGELNWISESLACARVTAQLVADQSPTTEVWSAFSVAGGWLSEQAERDRMLAAITAEPHQALFLLAHTTQESFAPIRDVAVLRGFRDVIEVMNEAQVPIVVGRRASSGLLLLALGATGWSMGVAGNLMNSAPHPEGPTSGGPPQDRVYVPQLLNHINTTTYVQMRRLGRELVELATTPGAALLAQNPALEDLTRAQRVLLLRHNLLAMKQQVDAIAATPQHSRVTSMRTLVLEAQRRYKQLPPARPGDDALFLTAWLAVL